MRQCPECDDTKLMSLGPSEHGGPNVVQRCDCTPPPAASDYDRAIQQRRDELEFLAAQPYPVETELVPSDWRDKLMDDCDET